MTKAKQLQLSNDDLVAFLSTTTANATFLQKLKIRYRPYVCPFNELLNYAIGTQSVYDIGCGSGQFCALVAEFTKVKNIYGIEIDKHLVAKAHTINERFSKKKTIKFSVFNGKTIPKNIKEYDLIYMIDVYHHIPTEFREDIIRQIYKKMKPGARLMFKDINAATPFVICNKIHDLIFAQEFSHEISFNKAKALFESTGFKIIEARKKRVFVYPHYFLLLEK